jgi:hypothetical protein
MMLAPGRRASRTERRPGEPARHHVAPPPERDDAGRERGHRGDGERCDPERDEVEGHGSS